MMDYYHLKHLAVIQDRQPSNVTSRSKYVLNQEVVHSLSELQVHICLRGWQRLESMLNACMLSARTLTI